MPLQFTISWLSSLSHSEAIARLTNAAAHAAANAAETGQRGNLGQKLVGLETVATTACGGRTVPRGTKGVLVTADDNNATRLRF